MKYALFPSRRICRRQARFSVFAIGLVLIAAGCASIFGWDIHAPGILSEDFSKAIQPLNIRIALYLPPELLTYESKDRGGKTADPQIYHVGEALAPMLVEGFQDGFEEFIFLETEPSVAVLKQYGIPYFVTIRIKDFKNRVSWHGQGIALTTETIVFDSDLKSLARFESQGTSDARKVFAKKGGPQVNLNAAIENDVLAVVLYLQDSIQKKTWDMQKTA